MNSSLVLDVEDTLSLLLHTRSTTFPGSLWVYQYICSQSHETTNLVLDATGLHLVGEDLGTVFLGLSLVNIFHEDTLVLEDITLGFLVKGVVPS